ncbi:MAG: RidA family protein [Rhodoplanes sp.]|uniref:RidA family protein n=1 Tax=Rhodoplanes sp. TaxID=1968906 RepID=UPI00184A1633|nr:RidA family protein [Rhodoplanes sp.]NVO15670.1 RidA family protein [Rhodoplanes sp.]
MPNLSAVPAVLFALALALAGVAQAQTAPAATPPAFEKKTYNYADWTKGRFSEAVTVTGPAKTIFLAGIGAEDEEAKPGTIRHPGDFAGQCKYAYEKIKSALAKNGATMGDVVKMVTYVTDIRFQPLYGPCRTEAFAGQPLPAHTFLNINQLAWPGMLVEIDVTAMVPLK